MGAADLVAVASIGIEPAGADRLHEQQRQGARTVLTAFSRRRRHGVRRSRRQHGVDRRREQHRDRRHDRRSMRARRSSTRSTTTSGCARMKTLAERWRRSSRRRRSSTSARACSAAAPTTRSSCARRSTRPCAPTCRSIRSTRAACKPSCPAATRGTASRGGMSAFSGSGVAQQLTQFQAQQETLTTLAADTGGTAFTDSNDFGEAFAKVEKDISSYYILGFDSTNPAKDGRFRRITIRLKNTKHRREGGGARGLLRGPRLHPHGEDRPRDAAARAIDCADSRDRRAAVRDGRVVPVWRADKRTYVPVSLAVPGAAYRRRRQGHARCARGTSETSADFPVGADSRTR